MRSAKLVVGIVIGIILLSLVVVVILGDGSDDRCRPNGAITGGGGVPAGELSLPIAEGDYVVIHGAGAYSVVTNTRFNGFGELRQLTVMGFD